MTKRAAPVAITGLACRFPGAASVAAFADMLAHGRSGISEIGPERWDNDTIFDPIPGQKGKSYARHGGFIDNVDLFDAEAFGIAPKEAHAMDPQQRLLLEIAAEAFEDAGLPPHRLKGREIGVFVGISTLDYLRLQPAGVTGVDAYAGSGNALSIAANRISYCFGLEGPSLAVDTACSSSLVATHLAFEAIERGEIDTALVAGVNLILSPDLMVAFSAARMLSPDGRCHTFDAGANGYVRGEGAGAVILRSAAAARKAGDKIYAELRGSAINQDGRSNGLTAPSGPRQSDVIKKALARAGARASDLAHVEAHGTGTPLGDPIELMALGEVLEDGGEGGLCHVGSAKTNIGHLEAAAGIAGLIKSALMLDRCEIFKTCNFSEANPEIPLADLPLAIARAAQSWPDAPGAVAGVSSFGFGGTNAHVILGPARRQATTERRDPPPAWPIVIGATTEAELRAKAQALAEMLETGTATYDALSVTLMTRATLGDIRAGGLAASREEAQALLRSIARQEAQAGLPGGDLPLSTPDQSVLVARPRKRPRRAPLDIAEGNAWPLDWPASWPAPRAAFEALGCRVLERGSGQTTIDLLSAVLAHAIKGSDFHWDRLLPQAAPVKLSARVWRRALFWFDLAEAPSVRGAASRWLQGLPGAHVSGGRASMKGALPADFPAHGGLVPFTLGLALMSAAGLSATGPMALKNIAILRPLRASEDLALSAQVEGGAVRVADGAGQAWMTADIAKRHDWASRSADQGLAGPRRTSGPAAALAACLLESAKTQGREGLPTAAEGFTPGDPGAGPWGLSLSEGGLALMLGDAAIGALDGLQLFEDRIALVRPEWEDIGFLPPDDLAATLKGAFARLPREESAAQNSALARGLTQAAADFAERALTAAAKNGRDHRGLARLREIAGQGRATGRRAEDILERLREDHAAHADEIALLGRCGAGWEKLLSGEADSALQFLVDPTDEDLLLRVYRDGPASLRANALTEAALSALIDARGDEHPLTLLEIGAGTGATTAHLLPLLPAGSRYIASDLAAGLLSALAKRHGGQNALETRLIDITRPLAEQGIAPSSIDIVVAANVLHAIEDPARALAGLLESLAPGAQLILQELTCRAPWLDLVFGLTDGWWAAQRDDGPLLRREGWHALFEDAGFSPVADAATAPPEAPGSQSVFVAQSARDEPLLRDQTHHLSEDGPHLQKAETAARLLLPDDAGARALARTRASEARGAARAYVSISTGDAAAPPQRFPACADPQLRVEGRRIKAFRLRHGLASVAWPKGAQVLILGGTGGIGRALACALKSKAARRIILASRSAGDDALTELGSGDGPCMIEACRLDLEDKEAARATITALLAEGVTHIVHAAGNDGANAPFEAALALARGAKVGGTEAALAALESHPDAAFVLLSSAAATLGLPGAAAYAMANAEAEARVWEARAKGQAASFIALGPVRDAGMANTANAASWARFGIGLLAQDEAMRGVAAALDNARAFAPALIAEIDWRKARPFLAYGQDAPHLAPLLKSAAPAPVPTPPPPPSPDAPEAEISKAPTRQIVTQTLAAVLGIGEARRIDPDRGLNELGLDSLTAVELANRLSRQTGLSLAPTAAFDYPTVNALAAHIAAQAGDDGAGDAAETGVPEPYRQSAPGSARLSLDELHALSDEEAWEKLVLEGG